MEHNDKMNKLSQIAFFSRIIWMVAGLAVGIGMWATAAILPVKLDNGGVKLWQANWFSQVLPVIVDPNSIEHAPIINAVPSLTPVQTIPHEGIPSTSVLGDHLKIVFYERLELNDEGGTQSRRLAAQGLVERTELTGEYVVQQNGHVVLPLIGTVEVAGRTPEQVTQAMEQAFHIALRREAIVSITLTEREPIYVVGKGAKTGTFKYTPGMTVLHAVALAGGADENRSDVYLRAEHFREREKLEKATQRLKPLLARAAVLHAERDRIRLDVPSPLIDLVGVAKAKKLVEEASHMRTLVDASVQSQVASHQAAIADARQEAANDTKRLSIMQVLSNAKSKRRDMVATLRKDASSNAYTYFQTESEVSELEVRKQEGLTILSQAKLRIARAEQDLKKLEADMSVELEREIVATDADIAEQTASISGSQRFINELQLTTYRIADSDKSVSFEIIRRTKQGSQNLPANEMTDLIPGDLVRISMPQEVYARADDIQR